MKKPDPAAAIYHWQQFLKLRPNYPNAETIKQHITNCKQDLAKAVLPLPIAPSMQRKFEQLAEENNRLQEEVEKWKIYASRLQLAATQPQPSGPAGDPQTLPAAQPPQTAPVQENVTAPVQPQPVPASVTRTHKVESGETPYSIARKYGVKLNSFMAANPGLEPRKLRVGQTVNIPSR